MPVARPNKVSPSKSVCAGRSARARPSWPHPASLRAWDLSSAALLFRPVRHAVGGGQAVRAAAGQDDRVDAGHQVAGVQGVGLAGGRAAADVDARRHAAVRCEDHRRAGQEAVADPLRVTDAQAGDVFEGVTVTWANGVREHELIVLCHGRTTFTGFRAVVPGVYGASAQVVMMTSGRVRRGGVGRR